MEGKRRDMWTLYKNLKLRDYFLKGYLHLRCYDFGLRYMSFFAFAFDNSGCFYSWLSIGVL